MSQAPHDLAAEFPDHIAKILELNQSDAHFAKMTDAYQEVNRALHQAGTDGVATDQHVEDSLLRQRADLKDKIAAILNG